MEPRIQYAKTSDSIGIAYAAEGEGPLLALMQPPTAAHVLRAWEMFSDCLLAAGTANEASRS